MEKKKVYRVQRKFLIHILKYQGQTIFSKQIREEKWVRPEKSVYIVAENEEEATRKYRQRYRRIESLNSEDMVIIMLNSLDYGEKIDKEDLTCMESLDIEVAKGKSYEFLQHNLIFEDFMELVRQELFPTEEN